MAGARRPATKGASRIGKTLCTFCVLSFVLCLLALTGCGFSPLYGQRGAAGSVPNQLGGIDIGAIEGRVGQQLRNHLIDRFSARGAARADPYRLEVSLTERKEGFLIRQDEAVTRYNYRLSGAFRLIRVKDQQLLFEDGVRTSVSYNVVQSEFATLSAERDAEARAARDLGDEIATRLAIFFHRPPG